MLGAGRVFAVNGLQGKGGYPSSRPQGYGRSIATISGTQKKQLA
jgi:hypothetical protein